MTVEQRRESMADRRIEAERPRDRRDERYVGPGPGTGAPPDTRIEGETCCDLEVRDPGNRDRDYEAAQRDAGGDYTTTLTGGIPVGETVELTDNLPDYLPGDEVDDIPTQDRNHPGTIDDIPYSMGQDTEIKPPLEPFATGDEERDLWREQKALIDEDRQNSLHLDGFPDAEIPRVLDALGDDAAEDSSGETVETRVGGPAHGGFPERRGTSQR